MGHATRTVEGKTAGGRVYRRVPIEDRFWDKVIKDYNVWGCWYWIAGTDKFGYGKIGDYDDLGERSTFLAHRVSWQWAAGQKVPAGLVLDHFLYPGGCIGPRCVNPGHLRPTTIVLNAQRSPTSNAAKTECPEGHPYDRAVVDKSGRSRRWCSICVREYNREYERSHPRRKVKH